MIQNRGQGYPILGNADPADVLKDVTFMSAKKQGVLQKGTYVPPSPKVPFYYVLTLGHDRQLVQESMGVYSQTYTFTNTTVGNALKANVDTWYNWKPVFKSDKLLTTPWTSEPNYYGFRSRAMPSLSRGGAATNTYYDDMYSIEYAGDFSVRYKIECGYDTTGFVKITMSIHEGYLGSPHDFIAYNEGAILRLDTVEIMERG